LTSICGLLIPSLALFSVLVKPKFSSKSNKLLSYRQAILGSSILLLFLFFYVEFLHVADSDMVISLVNLYKPLVLLRAPLTLLVATAFCFSVLATFSINSMTNYLGIHSKSALENGYLGSRNPIHKFRKWMPLLLSLLVVIPSLTIGFSFTPVFNPSFRDLSGGQYGYYADSPAYTDAIKWFMSQPDFYSFRTVFLPTWPVSMLNLPNSLPYTVSFSMAVNPYSTTFMSSLYDLIVDENSTYLGSFLALANVKYVAVTTGLNDSWRSFYITGQPRVYGDILTFPNFLIGDPNTYLQLMRKHADFALVFQDNNLSIFQNLAYIPLVSYFKNSLLFESNQSILDTLPLLPAPDKIVSSYALINYERNLDSYIVSQSSAIIYDSPDITKSELYIKSGYSKPIISIFDAETQVAKSLVVDPVTDIENGSEATVVFGSGHANITLGNTPYLSISGTTDQFGRLSLDFPANSSLNDNSSLLISLSFNGSIPLNAFSLYAIDSTYHSAKWDLLSLLNGYDQGWRNMTLSLRNALSINPNFNFSKVTTLRLEPIGAVDSPFSYNVGVPLVIRGYKYAFNMILPTKSNPILYMKSNQSLLSVLLDGAREESVPSAAFGWDSYPAYRLDGGNHSISILASGSEPITIAVFIGTTLEKLLQAPISTHVNPLYVNPGQSEIEAIVPRNTFIVLGESFDSHWYAQSGQEHALHARASDYANVFVFPGSGNVTINLGVSGMFNFELSVASRVGSLAVLLLVLVLLVARKRIKNLWKPHLDKTNN